MRIQIEVSPGELFDKLTILDIKTEKIQDQEKLQSIKTDQNQLLEAYGRLQNWVEGNRLRNIWNKLRKLVDELKELNTQIWEIEDKIRSLEKAKDFGPDFVQTARSVYFTNDRRAAVKKQINGLFTSDISEEKSYTDYA